MQTPVGASLLANGSNPVLDGEAQDAFASKLAPTVAGWQ